MILVLVHSWIVPSQLSHAYSIVFCYISDAVEVFIWAFTQLSLSKWKWDQKRRKHCVWKSHQKVSFDKLRITKFSCLFTIILFVYIYDNIVSCLLTLWQQCQNLVFEHEHVVIEFWHFPPIFVLLKLTCLETLFDRKLQVFKNGQFLAFLITFCPLKM